MAGDYNYWNNGFSNGLSYNAHINNINSNLIYEAFTSNSTAQKPEILPSDEHLMAKSRGWRLYKFEYDKSTFVQLYHYKSELTCAHKPVRIKDILLCPNCGIHAPKNIVITGTMLDPNFMDLFSDLINYNRVIQDFKIPAFPATLTNPIIYSNGTTTTSPNITINPNVTSSWTVQYGIKDNT
jgi:hypothetical protein